MAAPSTPDHCCPKRAEFHRRSGWRLIPDNSLHPTLSTRGSPHNALHTTPASQATPAASVPAGYHGRAPVGKFAVAGPVVN